MGSLLSVPISRAEVTWGRIPGAVKAVPQACSSEQTPHLAAPHRRRLGNAPDNAAPIPMRFSGDEKVPMVLVFSGTSVMLQN